MGLAQLNRALRLIDQGESRNGNGEIPTMQDLLEAVRAAAKAGALEALSELRKAEKEANSASSSHLTEQHRGVSWLESFWKFATNMFTKN